MQDRVAKIAVRLDIGLLAAFGIGLLLFVARYPIPPLTDYLAFIGLSMSAILDHASLLQLTPAYSYKLIHLLVWLATRISPNYAFVCAATYLAVLASATAPALLYLRCTNRLQPGVLLATLILGSVLLHSLLFIWGAIGFLLACWWAMSGYFLFLLLEDERNKPRAKKPLPLSLGFLASMLAAALSHPVGPALVLALGLFFLFSRLLFYRSRPSILLAGIAILLGGYVLRHDMSSFGAGRFFDSFKLSYLFVTGLDYKLFNLKAGVYYSTKFLLGREIYAHVGPSLSLTPFACLALLAYNARRIVHRSPSLALSRRAHLFATLAMAALCLSMLFGPDVIFKILNFPFRLLAALAPLSAAGFASILLLNNSSLPYLLLSRAVLCGLATLSLLLYRPIYADVQDYFDVASRRAAELIELIEKSGVSKEETVLVRYDFSFLKKPFVYRFIPYVMPLAPSLLGGKIHILCEWNDLDPHLPARIPPEGARQRVARHVLLRFTGNQITAQDLRECPSEEDCSWKSSD